MSNINLEIGGRQFAVSCADGEESHIEMLGRMIDDRARRMGGAQSETRMLLFAALMLADELHEAHRQAPAPQPVIEPVPAPPAIKEETVARVHLLAERIEKLALALEQDPASA
ncbi:conserved hypothetical protein [Novosphingobium aromaticivorans DSM 12444]|uniref:Cell division protein ZapA n=1 Tax=Novosphingobium aromaticivorans (strain ATCC 700278 / DSM 12444 / CCUG 56034 / CIP 105152 / NBRC 16084 / F199) TaxID=279238 RepID=Q2G6W3_NOVAD|nr:cell division protein ZapA [Novosphingobium aromaticivorans]ABD26410.1 conserved hypothetical protein [Novosphingobium aromaticivorans DSM 12444]SCY78328.1 cell division protein ZapA [Novosphingobium aromaticivorans]